MAAAVQSVLLVGTAAWLFYNTWLAVAALLPVGIWYWHEWREECCKRKEQLFREQFQNGIQILSSLLKADILLKMRYARRKKICVHCTGRAVGYGQNLKEWSENLI